MNTHRTARCLAVWTLAIGALGLAGRGLLVPPLRGAAVAITEGTLADQGFEQLLVWCWSAVGLVGVLWLACCVSAVALEALGSPAATRPCVRGVPAPLRRAVLAACGVALCGLAAPAAATPGALHADHVPASEGRSALHGLPLPDRAVGPARSGRVVVRPGDSLWAIAVASLPADASEQTVADRVRVLFAANRDPIGADPDLIRPGQVLRVPPGS